MKPILIIMLLLVSSCAYAQEQDDSLPRGARHHKITDRYISVLTSLNLSQELFAELGIAFSGYGRAGGHPVARAVYLSNEFTYGYIYNSVFAPKIGAWTTIGISSLAIGASATYYTSSNINSLHITPEAGFAINHFKWSYGYSFASKYNPYMGWGMHMFTITFLWGVHNIRS